MCPVLLVLSGVVVSGAGMVVGCVVVGPGGTPGRAGNKATFIISMIYVDGGGTIDLNLWVWYLRRQGFDQSERKARS